METFAARLATRAQRWSGQERSPGDTHLIERALLDTVGVAVAGWRLSSARIAAAVLDLEAAHGDGRIIGATARAAPPTAALMNGLLAHGQLFDDNSDPMIAHPSSPLLAVLLALGPRVGADASLVLDAYAAGFDASVICGRALNPTHYERGWHATATLGVIGATVAATKLLGCDVPTTVHALGIAVSSTGGLRQNFGTMTMGLHAGNAAAAAVRAALLARGGFTASASVFEGKSGYFQAFGGIADATVSLEHDPHELSRSGIQCKLVPSGAPTICAVEAALELAPRLRGPVERVVCAVDPWYEQTLKEDDPTDMFAAKVNLRYCVAAALVHGRLTLEEFEAEALCDPRTRALMSRTFVEVDPGLRNEGLFPARLTVVAQGQTLRAERSYPRGSPQNPASDEELVQKFVSCVGGHADETPARAVAAQLLGLERLGSEDLFDTLAFAPAQDGHRVGA